MNKKTISTRKYKSRGYILVKEFFINDEVELHSAYSLPDLYYIGNNKDAYRLYKKFGITEFYPHKDFEPIKELTDLEKTKSLLLHGEISQYKNSPVCCIGWSPRDKKWYGWSHRAIYGFSPGSTVKKGDCAYTPKDKQDSIEYYINFWKDEHKESIKFDREGSQNNQKGFWLKYKYNNLVPNESLRGKTTSMFCAYPDEWGKGEWTAKTWDDAKQMAIDFAESVG